MTVIGPTTNYLLIIHYYDPDREQWGAFAMLRQRPRPIIVARG